jgi:glycosyltransferase involved in cell wall biosynthesis
LAVFVAPVKRNCRGRSIDDAGERFVDATRREVCCLIAKPALLSSSLDTNESPENSRVRSNPQPAIWFEVEDFLRYFDHFRNPTGTQRLSFEIYSPANSLYGHSERVRFCRLSFFSKRLHSIPFDVIRSAYLNPLGGTAPWKAFWEPAIFWERFPRSIPVILRHPRFFLSIFKVAARDLMEILFRQSRFELLVRRGDIIVSLGAGWGLPGYARHIAEAKRRYGIKFAIFVHDVLPIEHQSFFEPRHAVQFRDWLQEVIPVTDIVLTNSKYSRASLIALAAKSGWRLPRVEVLELGSGFPERLTSRGPTTASLPTRYVLFVSTIEIRKNHRLLVRVWQRLVERHGADRVPALIFVGQIGWSIDGLLADLEATEHLNGKIILLRSLSDAELQQAYRGCLFTVFPSLGEGWGLPIAESLAHGKFCIASDRTSIPEVGGDLIDYFDPSNDEDALAKIERSLMDPDYLAAREARIQAEYRRRTWADCVHALMRALERGGQDDTGDVPVEASMRTELASAGNLSLT